MSATVGKVVGNLWRPDYFSENRTARGGDYRDGSPGNCYVPPGYNGPPSPPGGGQHHRSAFRS
jgi:hypothetical protein